MSNQVRNNFGEIVVFVFNVLIKNIKHAIHCSEANINIAANHVS